MSSASSVGKVVEDNERPTQAAIVIQKLWRRYIDIQVFKYYKDLVVFHNEGDPALIMKYINPIEAKLIDGASGIHIKFRLAGQQFPPTIYYKIFTHRPVQDICANAPRDYTRPYIKMKAADVKNNRAKTFPDQSFDGWYKRIENNGWRPVSNKHLIQMNLDYYFGVERDAKPVTFYHTKLARKQDVELKKKQKKVDWMRKMYKNGMLKAKGDDPEANAIIEQTTKELLDAFDSIGVQNVDNWEVDELLNWTNALNFDDYTDNWKKIGTTAESDRFAIERQRLKRDIEMERSNSSVRHSSTDYSVPKTSGSQILKSYKNSINQRN